MRPMLDSRTKELFTAQVGVSPANPIFSIIQFPHRYSLKQYLISTAILFLSSILKDSE